MTQRWAYLGPEGTFTEAAVSAILGRVDAAVELVPMGGVSAVLEALRSGEVEAGCVPLENSVEGAVPLTQDELTHGQPLTVHAEAFVPVTFDLLVRPGTTLADIRTVGSHPHGHAQVRDFLAAELPGVDIVVTTSTAAAAALVADGEIDAAAAAPVAGIRYRLDTLVGDIGMVRDAVTRFVLLRTPGTPPPPPTGNDRTSFIVSVNNEPGTLLSVLAEIAGRGINMTRLESRPTRSRLGEYVFLIDADGHIADPAMADMVAALIRRSALMRWLGSYPRMAGTNVPAPSFATAQTYDAAVQSVSRILAVNDPGPVTS
ncbi:prephenate dehydratase [Nakamurella panacisegetis]|uniref:Prephenate dehydratase n=1 Tax=Nakamurella panacisegetis TaxID=1090615 RepID=A0A1H0K764_9ACTN|nr:prephenate dehydratase [Nakamurella panacisegetis]SDO51805.1 prephenate dehydratase [Nakamurella panacisegetis]